MMPNGEALDNLLVRQKDRIINMIDDGQLETATFCLLLVTELWIACNYDYKLRELHQRIKNHE